jgi:DNA-binding NtrC family response regulator/tetratricopeptide (TPR) repeat protein
MTLNRITMTDGALAAAAARYAAGDHAGAAKGLLEAGVDDPSRDADAAVWSARVLHLWCLRRLDRPEDVSRGIERLRPLVVCPAVAARLDALAASLDMGAGRYADAAARAEAAFDAAGMAAAPWDLELLLLRGTARLRLGRTTDARADFEAGFHLATLHRLPALATEFAGAVGQASNVLGDHRGAVRYLEDAVAMAPDGDTGPGIGYCRLNLAIACYKLGRYRRAAEHVARARRVFAANGDLLNQARAHLAEGNVHRLLGDGEAARRHLTRAYAMAGELDLAREECLALEFLGDVVRDQGEPAEACRYYERGLAIARDVAPEGDLVVELLRRRGECRVLDGVVGAGLEDLATARAKASALGDRFEEAVILRCLADGLRVTGDLDAAGGYAADACSRLASIGARHEHALALVTAADILVQRADGSSGEDPAALLGQAEDRLSVAWALAGELGVAALSAAVEGRRQAVAGRRDRADTPPRPARVAAATGVVVACSRSMRQVLRTADTYAPHGEPVLLTGETGTGKDLVARRIHAVGARADGPFVAVNVTAIPASMFEREFFGHVRGAFSGADHDRDGFAAAAHGGTLFLDEIGDLPGDMQAKLLRLLQDGSYSALGDPTPRRADLRVVAATNADLRALVDARRFREDLYYRLATLTIDIAPLRERPDDVVPLLEHFLSQAAGCAVQASRHFDDRSIALMRRYAWPGNAREVALVARRAHIALQADGVVRLAVGEGADRLVLTGPAGAVAIDPRPDAEDRQALGRARVLLALDESSGNRSEAARRLGVSRATLYRRLAAFGVG